MPTGAPSSNNNDTKADKAIPALLDALEISRTGTPKTNKLRRIAHELKLKGDAMKINAYDDLLNLTNMWN